MTKAQIIFLHIPKTAGSTLRNIVYGQYGETRVAPIYPNNKYYFKVTEFDQLTTARKDQADAVIGHIEYGFHNRLSENRPYRYATMLRDPISCCSSLYNHLKNHQYAGSDISLKELLKTGNGVQFNNVQSRVISAKMGLKMEEAPTGLLETAINHIERDFAFVGITERFNESLLLASHDLGWQLKPYISRNISSKWVNTINYAEELKHDRESMDLLMELNEIDMRLYEYVNQRITENLCRLYPDLQVRLTKCASISTLSEPYVPKAVGNLGALQKRRIVGWAKLLETDIPAKIGITINDGQEFDVVADVRREDLLHLHYTGGCGFVLELPTDCWLKHGDEVSARIINAGGVPLHHSPKIFADK